MVIRNHNHKYHVEVVLANSCDRISQPFQSNCSRLSRLQQGNIHWNIISTYFLNIRTGFHRGNSHIWALTGVIPRIDWLFISKISIYFNMCSSKKNQLNVWLFLEIVIDLVAQSLLNSHPRCGKGWAKNISVMFLAI